MEISGDILANDSQGAAAVVNQRVLGYGWPLILGIYAVMAVAMFFGTGLVERINPGLGLPWIVLVGVVTFLGYRRWCLARVQVGWRSRGVIYPSPTTYRMDDEALTIVAPHYEVRCAWGGVSEIAKAPHVWIFIVPGIGYFIPRRLFPDLTAERAFLRQALGHLTPAALERSREVAAYASVES